MTMSTSWLLRYSPITMPEDEGSLGELADPHKFTSELDLGGRSEPQLHRMLGLMIRIRVVEEFIGEQVVAGAVKCPCHLAIGQEAVAVGVSSTLRDTDRIFGNHRSHGHYLAQGGDTYALLAEVLGKATGCSRGMGGSMHLIAAHVGFMGSVPIVGATVPIAVGAGLAAQRDGNGDVAVAYFGDGAMEEGAVHESLNFAAKFEIPVVFVVENNLFSSHLHISERQPADSVARFARAHRIRNCVVDGNDVVGVADAADELVRHAREGGGPGFLEAVTYRWRGHVGASEDIDVGVQRKDDLSQWKMRDPIRRLEAALATRAWLREGEVARAREMVWQDCESAWRQAQLDPYPDSEALLSWVFGGDQ
jgi:TPP-dependent pyruvate/acetoin dehydrogenase alpha subunit